METRTSPQTLTSKRRIKYRKSAWNVHEFEVWSGELVCKVSALRMENSLFIWVGGKEPHLSEMAMGMPMGNGQDHCALATVLMGDGGATNLARRLAFALSRPTYVCFGQTFDRFVLPLVEKGIATEVKKKPKCF